MFKFSQAAILIAVFLLLVLSGCYTRIKSPAVKIVPDTPNDLTVQESWDFGWGWYDQNWSDYNAYYGYYYVAWWDECRWCDDDESPDIHLFNNEHKINRRQNDYIPRAYHTGGSHYIDQPVSVGVQIPSGSHSPRSVDRSKSTSNEPNANDSKPSDNNNKKVKKRSRR
jgi:hypothetical protein